MRVSEAQQLPGWSVGASVSRNPYWLIVKRRSGRLEVLVARLPDGRSMLPVFSFEEEATFYLRNGIRGSWHLRRTQAGELVSLLCSLCSKVELVALDPIPGVETGMLNGLLSLERERFVAVLLCKAVSGRSPGTAAPVDTTPCEQLADPSPEVRARSLTSELQGHNPQEQTHRLPEPREKAASDPTAKA